MKIASKMIRDNRVRLRQECHFISAKDNKFEEIKSKLKIMSTYNKRMKLRLNPPKTQICLFHLKIDKRLEN